MSSHVAILLLLAAAAHPGPSRSLSASDPALSFRYAWPVTIPPLTGLEKEFAGRAAAARTKARRQALAAWKADRNSGDGNPPRHSLETEWSLTASSPRLLSFRADSQFYTGGAHEGIAYETLIWDRLRDRRLRLADIFDAPAEALRRMEKDYCAQLRRDQQERRGGGFAEADFRCPAFSSQPVALTGKPKISGFVVLLQPYAAGSWAEGPYEVEVAIAPSLLGRLKPDYRASFAAFPRRVP